MRIFPGRPHSCLLDVWLPAKPDASPRARDIRLDALREVLVAAVQTDFYGEALCEARLDRPQRVRMIRSLEDTLQRLPVQQLPKWVPVPAAPPVRLLSNGRGRGLLRPVEIVAGPATALLNVEDVPQTVRRVAVWTRPNDAPLFESTRDLLWEAFQLPVFEELIGFEGELLAAECDAHEALHIEESTTVAEEIEGELVVTSLRSLAFPILRLRTGLFGGLVRGSCGCGRSALRFVLSGAYPRIS